MKAKKLKKIISLEEKEIMEKIIREAVRPPKRKSIGVTKYSNNYNISFPTLRKWRRCFFEKSQVIF